ncbi:Putative ribonuclease H protein At1g65750 [Linum perenne]
MEIRNLIDRRRQEVEIAWKSAPDGWSTLNSDGSVFRDPPSSAAGMVIRDNSGRIQHAAAINLGRCSITWAEIRGAIEGMMTAWDMGIRRLEVQLDSTAAIIILMQGNTGHQQSNLVTRFQRLRERDWETKIIHAYREANHLANCLAGKGHNLPTGVAVRMEDNSEVRQWESYDARGVTESRSIRESH